MTGSGKRSKRRYKAENRREKIHVREGRLTKRGTGRKNLKVQTGGEKTKIKTRRNT